MSSNTKMTESKRKSKRKAQNRRRKNQSAKKSTLSYAELFAKMGEPEA